MKPLKIIAEKYSYSDMNLVTVYITDVKLFTAFTSSNPQND